MTAEKHSVFVSTDQWIKKAWFIYMHDGILFGLKKKIMSFTTTWMNMEDVMLCEICQNQKDKYCIISFVCGI